MDPTERDSLAALVKAVSREGMGKASGKGSIADSSKLLMFVSHGNLNMRKCRFSVWSLHDSDTERVRCGSEQECDVQHGVLFFPFLPGSFLVDGRTLCLTTCLFLIL